MAKFITVAHIYLNSEDYISAIGESDDIKLHTEKQMLETDDGESFEIIEVIDAGDMPLASEQVMRLRQARNILLNLRTRDGYELARSVDEQAYELESRIDLKMNRGAYDYGMIMRVLKEIMEGKNPIDH